VAANPKTGLTDKQERFCEEFLKSFNATEAYRTVYRCSQKAAESGGSRSLRNGKVQRYLSVLRSRVSRKAEVSLERTIQELARVAYSDITELLSFDSEGVTFRDSKTLPKDTTAAIESISSQTTVTRQGSQEETRVTLKAKLHNKMAALSQLMEFHGAKDEFNKARKALKRYGLLLLEDDDSESGWRVELASTSADTSDEDAVEHAIAAFSEAIEPPESE
jgi:phage terminase small subunit